MIGVPLNQAANLRRLVSPFQQTQAFASRLRCETHHFDHFHQQTNTAMNRRTFLTTTGAAALAATLGQSTAQAAAAGKRNIKIAVKYGMVGEGKTVLEKFKLAKEAGFDGIEPNGPLDEKVLQEMKDAIKETGLVVPGTVCPEGGRLMGSLNDDDRKKGIDLMAKSLRQTKELGGTTVLMYPGKVDKGLPYAKVYESLIKSTREVLPVAQETGIKIALENVWNNLFLSPLDAVRFVDEINDPHVGWFLDLGNLARYGWPEHWVYALGGKRIFKLDIKGYSTSKHMKEGPWAGFKVQIGDEEDEIDWAATMKALDEVGYKGGWISAEVGGGNLERLKQIQAQVARVVSL